MYIPKKFKQDNTQDLLTCIEQYPFATLITGGSDAFDAMHLPLYMVQEGDTFKLRGHIARANPLWSKANSECPVLVIFNGPNCYVSPNHYPTKKQNGRAVPTWNYVVVHVKGALRFIHDSEWIKEVMGTLTTQHEAGELTPWSMNDAPQEYIDRLVGAVVGIEIDVESITGKWKLSQNQPEVNQAGVISGLSQDNEAGKKVAELIKDNLSK